MEELGKLVNLQSILSFLEERHLSSNNQDSDRFLAEFTMFMAKQCGNLTMEAKFSLISDYLPKISPAILEEAALCLTGEGHQQNCGDLPTEVYCESESNVDVMGGYVEDMAMVGLESMQRANSTLEDFCRFYFIFHEMDVKKPELVFKYLPMLSFTESYIYQLDSYNEQILSTTAGTTDAKKPERNHIMKDHLLKVIKNDPFGPLVSVLEDHGLMTERIRAELRSGEEYWLLERKLCNSLAAKQQVLIEDVMRAIHLKSFDYRVLNLLLYQLRRTKVNDLHMEFLSVSEFLVEVSDDLFDYEDDVVENSFNILRMFVGIYGASKAPSMLAQCITEAEEKYVGLSKTLEENLSLNCWRRCEEATREGGKNSVHSFGTWHIPTVISDEGLYRLNNTQNRLDS
ncbi:uncharacterized protein LOC113331793 isoform X2 [Papaver somniferum]|uniref:uncharacterized protein LOC113331793 isoform X2 n=1 Tax=Papaver somniferum TaxID=3469 RepID=UPI000E6F9818|nr:uncharacterized protein LOC113331793 isoform X2 [Papaver somniferum]